MKVKRNRRQKNGLKLSEKKKTEQDGRQRKKKEKSMKEVYRHINFQLILNHASMISLF